MESLYNADFRFLDGKLTTRIALIIVKLNGGLGNQLFQYELGRHLAEINKTELILRFW